MDFKVVSSRSNWIWGNRGRSMAELLKLSVDDFWVDIESNKYSIERIGTDVKPYLD